MQILGWTSYLPPSPNSLSRLSLASSFGVWSNSEQTEQAEEIAHGIEKDLLYKASSLIHNGG